MVSFKLLATHLVLTLSRGAGSLNTTYTLTTAGGLGAQFDGVGAISGGGATSKLLIGYPPQQRAAVLDMLFKPNWGASLQILKVEVGGDGQATEGTESSHMHTKNPADEAYDRGYEWWLMKEAKARKDSIVLYGLPWTFPGWVTASGKGGRTGNTNLTAIADVLTPRTAAYVAKWVDGAKAYHNLTIDYMGLWNEHPPTPDYVLFLRAALDRSKYGGRTLIAGPDWHTAYSPKTDGVLHPFMEAIHKNASVRAAISKVGFHYPHRMSTFVGAKCAKDPRCALYMSADLPGAVWSSEESSTVDTHAGGACWARLLNQNRVIGNITASIMWNLVTSFYTSLPYFGASLMNAGQPWSGHYEVMTPIWATAHHTQFTEAKSWTYLAHGRGVGVLEGGGTYVTYVSPVAAAGGGGGGGGGGSGERQWTLVLEKIRDKTGPCLRDSFNNNTMVSETITFVLGEGLATSGVIQTWRSDWSSGKGIDDLFQPGQTLTPTLRGDSGSGSQMTITITIGADQVVTASSLPRSTHGHRGAAPTPPPAPVPFPSEYANDFEREAVNSEDLYFSDQAGKWEIRKDTAAAAAAANQVMQHVVPEIGVVYRGDTRPISVLGDVAWRDVEVSMRFRLESANTQGFFVSLRTLNSIYSTSQKVLPQATDIAGAYVVLNLNGSWRLVNSTRDTWNITIASGEIGTGPLVLNQWYNISLAVKEQNLTFAVAAEGEIATLHALTLEVGMFPSKGQLGIGLVDYGIAAIDDLSVRATPRSSH